VKSTVLIDDSMLKRSQTLESDGVRQTVPHINNSIHEKKYTPITASSFVQFIGLRISL